MSETDEAFLERMFRPKRLAVIGSDKDRLEALARRGADSAAAERRGMVKGLKQWEQQIRHNSSVFARDDHTLLQHHIRKLEQEASSEDNR